MLKHRLTFGPIMILLLAFAAWLDQWLDGVGTPGWLESTGLVGETLPPAIVVGALVFLVAGAGAREVARILRAKGVLIWTKPAVLVALAGAGLMGFGGHGTDPTESLGLVGLGVMGVFALGLVYGIRGRDTDGAMAVGSGVLALHVYMGIMPGFVILLRREHDIWVLIWVLACVKSCDIGAYFTGTTIGKNKLIPWLSPGKTWEGLAGGMATAGLVGGLGAWWLASAGVAAPPPIVGAAMGVLFGGLGQAGDLLASLLKRDAGVKDSGTALPGFGGVLDLIDSPIFVAPIAYWLLHTIGP
ncbi:MAG: phosphatidate cytidylyltransferase [Planctomycetota bacterium]